MTIARPKILVWGAVQYANDEFKEQVGALAEIVDLTSESKDALAADLETKYKGVVGIYHIHDVSHHLGPLDSSIIKLLANAGVKFIAHFGAGYDDVDAKAAAAAGINVSNTPGAVDNATATTCVFLIIAALRKYLTSEKHARNGQWKNGLPLANDPENKTLGIVGMGGIGKVVAKRMLGWNMKILYHNRKEISPKPDFPCEYVSSLDELLERSDVVSLHMPLSPATYKAFGKDQLAKMKDGAVLVNTARGDVVDEQAMIDELSTGRISAGLDVFSNEPKINPALLGLDNVVILPHMGTETHETRHTMGMVVINNLLAGLAGKALPTLVRECQ